MATICRYWSDVRWVRIGAVGLLLAASIWAAGCKRTSTASAQAVGRIKPGDDVPPERILRAYGPMMATVQTTWQQRGSMFSRAQTYGQEGLGMIVASDGRSALVLTSRRLVDPRFARPGGPEIRDVAFRVIPESSDVPGAGTNARLVAVYLNDTDLALLRIGAPRGASFAIPLADPASPRAGDAVTIIGPPRVAGLGVSEGVINNYWEDSRLGTASMRVRLTGGRPVSAGMVFSRRGGRLIGILRSADLVSPGVATDLFAESAQSLRRPEYWIYLFDELNTRQLLKRIR